VWLCSGGMQGGFVWLFLQTEALEWVVWEERLLLFLKKRGVAKKLGFSSILRRSKCRIKHRGRGRWVAISGFFKILDAPSGPGWEI